MIYNSLIYFENCAPSPPQRYKINQVAVGAEFEVGSSIDEFPTLLPNFSQAAC